MPLWAVGLGGLVIRAMLELVMDILSVRSIRKIDQPVVSLVAVEVANALHPVRPRAGECFEHERVNRSRRTRSAVAGI